MGGKRINWDAEKINFILENYTSHKMSSTELAQYFNCSPDTILRRLKENGIHPKKFYEDLTGKRFGRLVVLNKSAQSNRRLYWDCLCDCGNRITVKGDALRSGLQNGCGCINSNSEIFIANLLRENKVNFVQQYSFNDLKSEAGVKLRFDFGILKDNKLLYLIEYDGEQHFPQFIQKTGWNSKENYEKTHKHDLLKNNYCLNNKIPLIRIPYTKKHTITIKDLQLETTQFLFKEGE